MARRAPRPPSPPCRPSTWRAICVARGRTIAAPTHPDSCVSGRSGAALPLRTANDSYFRARNAFVSPQRDPYALCFAFKFCATQRGLVPGPAVYANSAHLLSSWRGRPRGQDDAELRAYERDHWLELYLQLRSFDELGKVGVASPGAGTSSSAATLCCAWIAPREDHWRCGQGSFPRQCPACHRWKVPRQRHWSTSCPPWSNTCLSKCQLETFREEIHSNLILETTSSHCFGPLLEHRSAL